MDLKPACFSFFYLLDVIVVGYDEFHAFFMAVAAIMASAVGNSAYLHLSLAASMAIDGSRFTTWIFSFNREFVLVSAVSLPRDSSWIL